ncbi:MAG TPA: protein DpdH [Kofleriaceae bacterium]|nr:protein DpdH [Kofleriaceae bacterium]
MRAVPPFPNAVCWDSSRRATVLNPIALDVPLAVFHATHHPSNVQREGAAAGSIVSASEFDLLEEFLSFGQNHVFTAAVGDTGTGKSHFIRWLYLEILEREKAAPSARHVVMIPRSAANLADVVRRILQDFEGDATARLRAEVERHRGLSEAEARQRVLDELAIAIGSLPASDAEDDETRYLKESIPALLRDHELRRALTRADDGIVPKLARHVLGQRETAETETLRWTPSDLSLPVQSINKAGDDARELASALLNDDHLRDAASLILQRALGPSIAALLRFRSGDLKRALTEIRAQLSSQGRELVLLLEDLSITEGLDGELLEALQVRTHDSGTTLCTLRSIVGLTREDYQRLRDNIKARLTRTLWFDAPIGHGTSASEDAALAEFAARYLNAVRLEPEVVENWVKTQRKEYVPSACEHCQNRGSCHDAFGEVDGYGLYPVTPTTLGRLYRQTLRAEAKAFKPRSLLKVLTDTLDEAERSIPRKEFPPPSLIKAFNLGSTTAELQLALRGELRRNGDRALRAVELYADQPAVARPHVKRSILSAFDLPFPNWTVTTTAPQRRDEPQEEVLTSTLDAHDHWQHGEPPADKAVNAWRQVLLDAIQACVDWDVEGIGYLRSGFGARNIHIDGQKTRTADPILTIARSPEAAVTMRVLMGGVPSGGTREALLRTARIQIEQWTDEVRRGIQERARPSSGVDGLEVGIALLALGSFIRGIRPANEAALLDACMRADWELAHGTERGTAWSALLRSFQKHGPKVHDVVHHALSCTKGGQAGSFLDPTRVIATLRTLRRGPLPSFTFDASIQWGVFRDVGTLAREVEQHLRAAIEEEQGAIETWLSSVSTQLGNDSPTDVVGWIGEALEAAGAVGSGDTTLRKAIEGLQGRAVKGCLDAAQKVVAASDDTARVVALGALDRTLMKDLSSAIELAATSLVQIEAQLQQHLRDALGDKTPEDWLEEIYDRLDRIDAAYSELMDEAESDG